MRDFLRFLGVLYFVASAIIGGVFISNSFVDTSLASEIIIRLSNTVLLAGVFIILQGAAICTILCFFGEVHHNLQFQSEIMLWEKKRLIEKDQEEIKQEA
jgi:hypothetical protein